MSKFIKRNTALVLSCLLIFGLLIKAPNIQAEEEENDFDVIVSNGTILDGSGLPKYDADIGINNGYISYIGDLQGFSAERDIDAEGLFVTPGFIDPHTHATVSAAREGKSALTQGVTTEFVNADGFGTTDLQDIFDWEEGGLGINIAPFIGFNATWKEVVGEDDRDATSEEIQEMQGLVNQGLEDGAFGVSSGLFYTPANYANTDEVIDVVSAARDWRTNLPTHIRNENDQVIEATEEVLQIGEAAGIVPVVDHMKAMGPGNWGKTEETVGMMEDVNDRGDFAAACVYPYDRSSTGLTAIVPQWVQDGGRAKMLERFADPDLRPQIEAEIEETMHSRVESPEDVYLPSRKQTLADYMDDIYDGSGKVLSAVLNFDYDNGNAFNFDEMTIKNVNGSSDTAFHYDFNGDDGDAWNPEAFDLLHSYPQDPDAVTYSIQQNVGLAMLERRQEGKSSAYGKIAPNMNELENSEVLMRFRVDETGNNQRLRLYSQADLYSSGSSMPENGYGIELDLKKDELILQGREDGKTTVFDRMNANMTTDWHWLKLLVDDHMLNVRIWDDESDEPENWDMTQEIDTQGKEEDISPGEATMRILEAEGGSISAIYRFGVEEDIKRVMQSANTGICSDGGASTSSSTHPRHYGTFTRVLGKYVREENYLEWEEAIKKMTSLTAARVGMVDRGLLVAGMKADITIFDPETVIDTAIFDDPKQYS